MTPIAIVRLALRSGARHTFKYLLNRAMCSERGLRVALTRALNARELDFDGQSYRMRTTRMTSGALAARFQLESAAD